MAIATTEMEIEHDVASPAGEATSELLLRAYQLDDDAAAFARIVTRHLPAVHAICRRATGNAHDAEDAAQVTFLNLAMQARAGTPIACVGAWLAQVAHRASLDLVRSHSRRRRREASRTAGRCEPSAAPSPTLSVIDREIGCLLRAEIGKLPTKYRLPLILHYFGQMDADEVSRELGCSRGALAVRLHRGRKLLNTELARRGVTILSGALGLSVIDAVLTSLCRGIKVEAAKSIAHATAVGSAKPLAGAMALRIMGVVRACSLAGGASRLKLICAALLFVSATLANAPTLREALAEPLNPRAIVDGILRRLSNSMSGIERIFRSAIPNVRVSSKNTPAGQAPANPPQSPMGGAPTIAMPQHPPIALPKPWEMDLATKLANAPLPVELPLPPLQARYMPMTPIADPGPQAKPPQSEHGFMVASAGAPLTLTGRGHSHRHGSPIDPTGTSSIGTTLINPIPPIDSTDPSIPIDVPIVPPSLPLNDLPTISPDLLPGAPIPAPVENGAPQAPEPASALVLVAAGFLALQRRRATFSRRMPWTRA